MRKIWIDTETLGIDEKKYPLVQIAAVYEGQEFNGYCIYEGAVKCEALALMTNDYVAKTEAVNLTKENKHHPEKLALDFLAFLKKAKADNGGYKLTPAGHNVGFDLRHLDAFFERVGIIGVLNAFDYHTLDTMTLALTLKDMGLLALNQRLNLTALCERFGVKLENAHDALADIKATAELYSKMTAMIKRASV
jgi:DNA polymerase III subunit epsilon